MRKLTFARRALQTGEPIIRVIDALAKKDPELLAFGEGNPAIEAVDHDTIYKITEDILKNHSREVLRYTATGGDDEFKELIAKRLKEKRGIDTTGNDILIMTGGQQGLYLFPRIFCNEGDTILAEAITYSGTIDAMRDNGCNIVGIKLEDDGINIEDFEEKLKTVENVGCIYLIPNFSNPTGITTSLEKRKKIYELACKYDKIIVEDDPYGDLRYEGEDVPTFKSMDTEKRVVYLGTFSKTIAAGLRVGYMIADPEIIKVASANKSSIDSNTAALNQLICRNFLRDYDFEANVRNITAVNKTKWAAAKEGFNKYLPEGWRIYDAHGGIFIFVCAPEGIDEDAFQEHCYKHKVALSPAASFTADGKPVGGFRMAFTMMTVEQIEEGCRRFGEAARTFKA